MYVCVREWRGERDLSKLESKAWFAMEETRERERERDRERERNSKGKAKMKVNRSGIYIWVRKKKLNNKQTKAN